MLAQSLLEREYLRDRYEYWKRGKHQGGNLYNERTFYQYFIKDLLSAKREVIIYSPFVSKYRTDYLKRTIEELRKKNVEVFIFTRPIEITTYDSIIQDQIQAALDRYEEMGANVYYLSGYIHEKVAIIDREILWEGSLNILSQKASREMMRRTEDKDSATQVIRYLGINKKLTEAYKNQYEKLCEGLIIRLEHDRLTKLKIFLVGVWIPIVSWLLFIVIKAIV